MTRYERQVKRCLERPELIMFYNASKRAKNSGVPCTIREKDIAIPEICPILGIVLKRGHKVRCFSSPSLDRINCDRGYVPGNIAVISDRANRIKNDGSAEEHRKIAHWILSPKCEVSATSGPKDCNSRENIMLIACRSRSRLNNLDFDLRIEDIVIPEFCPILGVPLSHGKGSRNRHNGSPSLDRVDPTKGYVRGNVSVISYRANRVKNNGTAEEHLKIADWMDQMENQWYNNGKEAA